MQEMHKRLRIETPRGVAQTATVPATPPPTSPAVQPSAAQQAEAAAVGNAPLSSAEQKVCLVLERSSQQTFCEELGVSDLMLAAWLLHGITRGEF